MLRQLLFGIVICCLGSLNVDAQKSLDKNNRKDRIKIDKILDMVLALPEVKAEIKYVEKESKGTRHLAAAMYATPSENRNYYWVKVWEDNGMNYVSHFNFFVDPQTLSIKYLDTINDTLLDLKAWRHIKQTIPKSIH
ncbi:hypothetical protein CJD36_005680 [Flavipsychrobacter stenotrophus]|uniref:Uncharacterized protein n=1 Tax=Flavipsychrobacter stenotrophus TaxID=2077091 RepID=A0A2S7SWJ9_9BACT|nr:hypothetical protein [Flavipsychrobacter stenotrophus]PQJ11293.1 hypothetical protein CJD36_005680 [Flavipsychrobacter stenotrophus]